MTQNNQEKITWGDDVVILASAPIEYRPSAEGSVCGIYALDTLDKSRKYSGKLGVVMYLVEFPDGYAVEIPGEFVVRKS